MVLILLLLLYNHDNLILQMHQKKIATLMAQFVYEPT